MRRRAIIFTVLCVGLAFARRTEPQELSGGGEALPHQAEPGEGNTTLWKTANFVLLAAALGYLLAKRGGPFFAERTAEVRRGLEEAAKMKAEAERRYAEMDQRLSNLDKEIENLRAQAGHEAAAEGERVHQETARQLQRIQLQAEQEVAAAGTAARKELRAYAAGLAIEVATRRIRDQLTPDSESGLIEGMLNRLSGESAGQAVRAS